MQSSEARIWTSGNVIQISRENDTSLAASRAKNEILMTQSFD
jgi:hypothetical protein